MADSRSTHDVDDRAADSTISHSNTTHAALAQDSDAGISDDGNEQWADMEELDELGDDDDDDDEDMEYIDDGEDDDEDEDGEDDEFESAPEELEVSISDVLRALASSGQGDMDDDDADEDNDAEVQVEATPTVQQQATGVTQRIALSRNQILQLLRQSGLRQLRFRGGDTREAEESDSEADMGYTNTARPSRGGPRGPRGRDAFEKVPSEEGQRLMQSGIFGSTERRQDTFKRKRKLAARIMHRELGLGGSGFQKGETRYMAQSLIPSTKADMIIHHDSRCYSGQFSRDGLFFYSCAQDFKVRMYDTSNPYDWKYYKTVDYPYGQWTITDASLSPDNKFLAYSSIRSTVCMASTDPNVDADPHLLDFSNTRSNTGRNQRFHSYPFFGIWSLRFSGDGREIVAGTGDQSVYVYDIETSQSIVRIQGHDNDVNAVCYGDSNSPHILYSGSDDTTLKVWDRRSLGDGREAGVFLGHTEGLTYVDSKGDGRYVLSNAKDQTAKLWDLRKMHSKDFADKIDTDRYTTGFEYRSSHYDDQYYRPHPYDCSLVTFRGHSVLKTLIRCHFSPPSSTDSRYIYSGSYDGKVYIYNLDATLAGTIDVLTSTRDSRPADDQLIRSQYDFIGRNGNGWQTCVRDASWHPDAPLMAATSWNGWGTSFGTCSVHSWRESEVEEGEEEHVGGGSRRFTGELVESGELYSGGRRRQGRRVGRRLGVRRGVDESDDDE